MLYATTRNNLGRYCAKDALLTDRDFGGGMYVPGDPGFSQKEIDELSGLRFSDCVARVLNVLFDTQINGYDVDFCVGRMSVRLDQLNQKILLAECYHNPGGTFQEMVQAIGGLLSDEPDRKDFGSWLEIGVRIAVLFGIYGAIARSGLASRKQPFDVSCVSGDFSGPVSAWYARQWGLPIGNIICCCNENSNLWYLLCHGQLRTDGVAAVTRTPLCDVVLPRQLERLIFAVGGEEAVSDYLDATATGSSWYVEEPFLQQLNQGIYVSVVGQERMTETVARFYATNRRVLSPYAALSCAGLQDYRSRKGENRLGLVLSERSPECDCDTVADALGIHREKLRKLL